jgi:dTDP-4-dehydrorhamnose reductase
MRIAVTGKAGQLVSALLERGAADGVEVIALARPVMDLTDPASVTSALTSARPDVIVSAAAYTAVDKAERERDLAFAINRDGARVVAQTAARLGVPVVHISTDYVFDGRKAAPYSEDDETGPLGVYGESKLAGERAVAEATADHAILRAAWVYSPFGANFLKTMLRVATERPNVRVVSDQIGSPTSAHDLADSVVVVARNLVQRPGDSALRGVFHLTGRGEASWADFASEIFRASAELDGPAATVERIATADYPTAARRPANSRLDSRKAQATHGVSLRHWKEATDQVVRRLIKGATP